MEEDYELKNSNSYFNLELDNDDTFEDEELVEDEDLFEKAEVNVQDFDSYIFNKLEELSIMKKALCRILDDLTQKQVKSTVF